MTRLEALGLVETTSNTQRKNGTRRFHDPITGANYMSYESGYIRREYMTRSWRTGEPFRTIYQLNPIRKVEGRYGEMTQRILIPNETTRLDSLIRAAANYRVTTQKEQERISAYKKQQEQDRDMTLFQDTIYQYFQGNLNFDMAIHEIKTTLAEISKK